MYFDRLSALSRPLLIALVLGGCGSDGSGEEGPPPFSQTPSPTTAVDAGTPATTPPATTPPATTPPATTPPTTTPPTTTPPVVTPPTMVIDAGIQADAGNPDGNGEGGTTPPSTGGIMRGEMPTEATTMKNGPYPTKSFTSGFKMASGATSSTVYYPDSPDAKPPFAGVAVVPGFVSPESSIQQWGPFLASHGIVTVTIGVPDLDQPEDRAMKLLGTIDGIKAENTRSGSPLMGKIDVNRMGVSGWSMGGGGTLISAARTPTLKAAVSFAAWGPTGGKMDKVPVLMFEGTTDPLAAGMSEPYYNDVPMSVPKIIFEVNGAGHDVANSPKNSGGQIGSWGLSWFKTFLEGDERYRQFIKRPKPSITAKFMQNVP